MTLTPNGIERADATSSDVKLKSLAEILSRDRKLILIISVVFMLIAAVGAFVSEKEYKATIQFAVVTSDQHGGGAGGMMSQFGALASLAGVSLGGESEKFEALATLQSRSLTEMFIQQNGLMPILYPKLWDAASGRWKISDPKAMPTLWKADVAFRKIRAVVQDPKTGLVTLSITWRDPALASQWANGLVALTNMQMRDRAIRESERNIGYLRDQATKTELVPVQMALSTLMESQYKQSMLAGGNDEYALKVIDPAAPPESPSSIRRIFVILGGLLGGLFVAILFVLVRSSWRGER
jgi:uncharacterized protein involved in exopolysaccharide biosynthesis